MEKYSRDAKFTKSSLNVISRFLEMATLRKMTDNEINFTIG